MLKYEGKQKPLLPLDKFYKRILNNFVLAMAIMAFSLAIGVLGYMFSANLKFADAFLNASMILGGMGPVDIMPNDAAKYFSSFYALFSGVSFLSTVALLLAPAIHRTMHRFHLETDEDEVQGEKRPS